MVVLKDIASNPIASIIWRPSSARSISLSAQEQSGGNLQAGAGSDTFARRLQVQETMNAQIANLHPARAGTQGAGGGDRGDASCMTTRGVHKPGVTMVTSSMSGEFRKNR